MAGGMLSKPGQLVPAFAAVSRSEESCIFRARIDSVNIDHRRLKMPDPLEFPGMLGTVVPLVGTGNAVIYELIADRIPSFATVIGALHRLPEPTARLRRIDAVGINGRTLEMVDL